MQDYQEDKISKALLIFIIVSLSLHLGIFVFFYQFPLYRSNPSQAKAPAQEVIFVRPEALLPKQAGKALPIVDLAKPKVQKVPKKARFVSPYNSSVKKETVARRIPKKANPKIDVSEAPKQPKRRPKKATKKPKVVKQTAPEKTLLPTKDLSEQGKKGAPKSRVSLSDLELKTSDFKDLMGNYGKEEKTKKFPKESKTNSGKDIAMLPRAPRPSGPGDRFVHDFMPGVKIGGKTYLNTHAMPNVQYFTRLKRIFRIRFNPRNPLVSHFRSNRVVVGKVNVTMAMEVRPNGQLKKLFVIRSSGIPGYDQEALRTVRQSAPFSAPPKAIQGKDGILRMTWHFTTYL